MHNPKQTDWVNTEDADELLTGYVLTGELLGLLENIDTIILPIGGGGLSAGLSSYYKKVQPNIRIIGVQPDTAPSYFEAVINDGPVVLDKISTFVDGASVKKVGDYTFPIMKKNAIQYLMVTEKEICMKIVEMYNKYGYVIEPAGVMSLCALDNIGVRENTNVACIISGGNSDIRRVAEILKKCDE